MPFMVFQYVSIVFQFPLCTKCFAMQDPDPEEAGTKASRDADDPSRVVEVTIPLGIDFEERDGGDIYIKSVDKSSDAYAQGIRPGAQLVMISATFGDEMWNTRKASNTTQFRQCLALSGSF